MSRVQRIFIAISIALALGAAGAALLNKNTHMVFHSVKVKPQYYMPPDIQPNCVNEFGCNIKTRIPLWLQDHLTDVEITNQSQQHVVIVETNVAVLKSLAYGTFVGTLIYGFLFLTNLTIRAIYRHRKLIVSYLRSQFAISRA
ncbi:hypothetical protein [Hirschia baltica]|uniref:Transmembrane protein n=1 Tax=Hirschia baltica (strain ATCC 49814 / DSM 5838 / IFAM 1418) TaxID=582402 RepID=C6XMC0_HIRBI|nr:hypothetical protein [Hirschia baltica]ACT58063.1 hypothetical protein Hbal_0361 [Hirschia baltica ATCC 49814]